MIVTSARTISADPPTLRIEVTPDALPLTSDNVAQTPLRMYCWENEGAYRAAHAAYWRLQILSAEEVLQTIDPPGALTEHTHNWVSGKNAWADSILVVAYENAARTVEIARRQVGIVAQNPILYPREDAWAAANVYKNGELLIMGDVVYQWVSRVPGNTSVDPATYIAAGTKPAVWKAHQYWPLLATRMLLAKFALVGSAVFKDEYMFSQQGTGADTYQSFTDGESGFIPNFLVNFLTGEARMLKAYIEGDLHAGSVGDFTIDKGISNVSDAPTAYVQIEKNGGKFFRLNMTNEDAMIAVRADGETAARLRAYGAGSIGLNALAQGEGSTAILARGNVDLNCAENRTNESVGIYGLRLHVRVVTATTTVRANDDILVFANSEDVTATLSSTLPVGKVIYVKKLGEGSVTLSGGTIIYHNNNGLTTSHTVDGTSRMYVKIDSTNWLEYHC